MSFPTVLPYHLSISFACRLPPTFWLPVRHLCCFSPPQKKKNNKCVPHRCFTNTFFHSTTLLLNPMLSNPLLPNPCCAPYTLPLGSTPVTHPPCHTPNPLTPLLLLPSTIIHALIWCRGRSLSIGPRAACSLNGMSRASYSAYATTRSGRSSTPPRGNS